MNAAVEFTSIDCVRHYLAIYEYSLNAKKLIDMHMIAFFCPTSPFRSDDLIYEYYIDCISFT